MSGILDQSIHGAMMFRLLFNTQDDRYDPDTADLIIDSIREQGEQVATLTITLAIDAAHWETRRWNRRVGRWR